MSPRAPDRSNDAGKPQAKPQGAAKAAEGGKKKTLHCPRCVDRPMTDQVWGGVPFNLCLRCGTDFFAFGALAAWEGWTDDVPTEAERGADHRAVRIHCPSCETEMERLTFPIEPPLELERCPHCHGIVLGFEEIRRVPEVGRWAASRARVRAKSR